MSRRVQPFRPLLVLTLAPAPLGAQQGAPADPHDHAVSVHETPWTTALAPQARMVRLQGPVAGSDTVVSPDGAWRAFVFEPSDEPGGRLCLETVRGGRRYELRGLPLPYRPLSALVWLDADRLAFDRWSQPHYGIHYVLEARRARLVLATPFPDEFFRRQGVPGPDTAAPPR